MALLQFKLLSEQVFNQLLHSSSLFLVIPPESAKEFSRLRAKLRGKQHEVVTGVDADKLNRAFSSRTSIMVICDNGSFRELNARSTLWTLIFTIEVANTLLTGGKSSWRWNQENLRSLTLEAKKVHFFTNQAENVDESLALQISCANGLVTPESADQVDFVVTAHPYGPRNAKDVERLLDLVARNQQFMSAKAVNSLRRGLVPPKDELGSKGPLANIPIFVLTSKNIGASVLDRLKDLGLSAARNPDHGQVIVYDPEEVREVDKECILNLDSCFANVVWLEDMAATKSFVHPNKSPTKYKLPRPRLEAFGTRDNLHNRRIFLHCSLTKEQSQLATKFVAYLCGELERNLTDLVSFIICADVVTLEDENSSEWKLSDRFVTFEALREYRFSLGELHSITLMKPFFLTPKKRVALEVLAECVVFACEEIKKLLEKIWKLVADDKMKPPPLKKKRATRPVFIDSVDRVDTHKLAESDLYSVKYFLDMMEPGARPSQLDKYRICANPNALRALSLPAEEPGTYGVASCTYTEMYTDVPIVEATPTCNAHKFEPGPVQTLAPLEVDSPIRELVIAELLNSVVAHPYTPARVPFTISGAGAQPDFGNKHTIIECLRSSGSASTHIVYSLLGLPSRLLFSVYAFCPEGQRGRPLQATAKDLVDAMRGIGVKATLVVENDNTCQLAATNLLQNQIVAEITRSNELIEVHIHSSIMGCIQRRPCLKSWLLQTPVVFVCASHQSENCACREMRRRLLCWEGTVPPPALVTLDTLQSNPSLFEEYAILVRVDFDSSSVTIHVAGCNRTETLPDTDVSEDYIAELLEDSDRQLEINILDVAGLCDDCRQDEQDLVSGTRLGLRCYICQNAATRIPLADIRYSTEKALPPAELSEPTPRFPTLCDAADYLKEGVQICLGKQSSPSDPEWDNYLSTLSDKVQAPLLLSTRYKLWFNRHTKRFYIIHPEGGDAWGICENEKCYFITGDSELYCHEHCRTQLSHPDAIV